MQRCLSWIGQSVFFLIFWACTPLPKEKVLGDWEVNLVKLSGNNRTSYFSQHIKWISLLGNGTYIIANERGEFRGKWWIRSDKLTLYATEVKDISGKVISPERFSEWACKASDGYMFWEGTAKYDNQKIKISFQKASKSQQERQKPLLGEWSLYRVMDQGEDISAQYLKSHRRWLLLKTHYFITGDESRWRKLGGWSLKGGHLHLMEKDSTLFFLELHQQDLMFSDGQGFQMFFKKEGKQVTVR